MTTSTLTFRQLSIEEIKELSLQAPTTEQSIQQAKENANRLWLEAAKRIVYDLCVSREEFTTDDAHRELDKTMHTTHDKRAMGYVMRKAISDGWCRKSGMMVYTKRKNCHSSDIHVYQSEIYASGFVDQL